MIRMNKIQIGIVLLLTILISPSNTPVSGQSNLSVLILYSDPFEQDILISLINSEMVITSKDISNLGTLDLTSYDVIFIVSSNEFSINESEMSQIESYIIFPNTTTFIFTQKIDDLSDGIKDLMGVDSIGVTYGLKNSTSWEIEINQDIGNYSIGDKFEYSGEITLLNLSSSIEILASIISSNSTEEEPTYPIPILFNSSLNDLYFTPISFLPNATEEIEEKLQLDQFPFPEFISGIIDSLIDGVISSRLEKIISFPETYPTSNTTQRSEFSSAQTTVGTNGEGSIKLPDFNPFTILIISAISMIALFIRKIIDNIRWLFDKLLVFGVGIVGAYFNIQDRNLNHGEVLLNQYRSVILDLLDHVGSLGAHLREIKNITTLGSGSLLWHLQVLEDFGLIQKFNVKRHTVFVSLEHAFEFDFHLKELELQLQTDHSKELLAKLSSYETNELIRVRDLLEGSVMNRKTAMRILRKITKYGLIEFDEEQSGFLNIINRKNLEKLQSSSELRDSFTGLEDKQVDISYN